MAASGDAMSCAAEADLDHVLAMSETGGDSLYGAIDMPKVRALNEAVPGSATGVFKPWAKRATLEPACCSDADDPELIIHVPFTSTVLIRSITIGCNGGDHDTSCPASVRLFVDREDVDFEIGHDLESAQDLDGLVADPAAEVDHALRGDRFRSVASLTLFITDSAEGNSTRISYIGLKGRILSAKQKPIKAIYELIGAPEAKANPLADVPRFVC